MFLALSGTFSLCCLCVKYLGNSWKDLRQIHRGRVWSLTRMSFNVKVANEAAQWLTAPFRRCRGWFRRPCVRCMFGKTSLALVMSYFYCIHAVRFFFMALWFFVSAWNISGIAERICAKFIGKTCLVPRSDEFEGEGQRSRSPGTKPAFSALSAACVRFMFLLKHL